MTLRHSGHVRHASFNSSGDRIVTASDDGVARIWNADGSGEPIVLQGHERGVVSAMFTPAGDRVVTTSVDGTARVWRVEAQDLIAAIKSRTRICLDADFRERFLGDSPRKARKRWAACERSHGRDP